MKAEITNGETIKLIPENGMENVLLDMFQERNRDYYLFMNDPTIGVDYKDTNFSLKRSLIKFRGEIKYTKLNTINNSNMPLKYCSGSTEELMQNKIDKATEILKKILKILRRF